MSAFQFPSNANPEGIVPIAAFIAVCICAPVAKLGEFILTAPVTAATKRAVAEPLTFIVEPPSSLTL